MKDIPAVSFNNVCLGPVIEISTTSISGAGPPPRSMFVQQLLWENGLKVKLLMMQDSLVLDIMEVLSFAF